MSEKQIFFFQGSLATLVSKLRNKHRGIIFADPSMPNDNMVHGSTSNGVDLYHVVSAVSRIIKNGETEFADEKFKSLTLTEKITVEEGIGEDGGPILKIGKQALQGFTSTDLRGMLNEIRSQQIAVGDTDRVVITTENGITASLITLTELTALSGITGNIQDLLDGKISISEKGAPNGVATLTGGKLTPDQVPELSITDTFVVNSQVSMLALTAQRGDVAIRTDLTKSFILRVDGASTLANWQELLSPSDTVLSVNGQTGIVVLDLAKYNDSTLASNTVTFTSADTGKFVIRNTALSTITVNMSGWTNGQWMDFLCTGTGSINFVVTNSTLVGIDTIYAKDGVVRLTYKTSNNITYCSKQSEATEGQDLEQVLLVGNDGKDLGLTNIGGVDSGLLQLAHSGLWQVRKPVTTGKAPTFSGFVTNTSANGSWTEAGTRDAGSSYGTFPYYTRGSLFLIREGWFWLVTSSKDVTPWGNSIAYGAGGLTSPFGYYTKYGSETGSDIVCNIGIGVGSGIVDSLVVEGTLYVDEVLKTRLGYNVGGNTSYEEKRVSHKNEFAMEFNSDGSMSLPLCDINDISEPKDLVTLEKALTLSDSGVMTGTFQDSGATVWVSKGSAGGVIELTATDATLTIKMPTDFPINGFVDFHITGSPIKKTIIVHDHTNVVQFNDVLTGTFKVYRYNASEYDVMVSAKCSNSNPVMNGTASQGASERFSSQDHVHPVDTGRAPTNHSSSAGTYGISSSMNYGHAKATGTLPRMNGTQTIGSETAEFARGDHIHPSDTGKENVGVAASLLSNHLSGYSSHRLSVVKTFAEFELALNNVDIQFIFIESLSIPAGTITINSSVSRQINIIGNPISLTEGTTIVFDASSFVVLKFFCSITTSVVSGSVIMNGSSNVNLFFRTLNKVSLTFNRSSGTTNFSIWYENTTTGGSANQGTNCILTKEYWDNTFSGGSSALKGITSNIAAGNYENGNTRTFTVTGLTGAVVNDPVVVTPSVNFVNSMISAGSSVSIRLFGYVSASGTVTIKVSIHGSAVYVDAHTFSVAVIK